MISQAREYREDWQEMLASRHPSVRDAMRWFEYGHLPEGGPREASAQVCGLAIQMLNTLKDGPELVLALRRLCEAKDYFVKQALVDSRG